MSKRYDQTQALHEILAPFAEKHEVRVIGIIIEQDEPLPAPDVHNYTIIGASAMTTTRKVPSDPQTIMNEGPNFSEHINVEPFEHYKTAEDTPEGTTEERPNETRSG